MEIRLDRANLAEKQPPAIDLSFSPERRFRDPTAGADGVSFPAVPTLTRLVVATTIIALGTSSLGSESIDEKKFQNRKIVFPSATQVKAATTGERYARLKQEIVAAGIPLLTDEELREEIRSRKGVKLEPKDETNVR
jgi:hypothetical protein